jgi:WhiB family redox-sensing transcriptional regulator
VCAECPVQADCLQFALATNQDSGIWGGTTEEDRRKLRRAYVARQKAAVSAS